MPRKVSKTWPRKADNARIEAIAQASRAQADLSQAVNALLDDPQSLTGERNAIRSIQDAFATLEKQKELLRNARSE